MFGVFQFKSSLVVLWDIMVVNNWQIFIEAYVSVTSEWHRLYFIFWWVLCTVITLNMCISLILDVSAKPVTPTFAKSHLLTVFSFSSSLF